MTDKAGREGGNYEMNIIISIEGVTLPEVSAHVSRCFVSLDWGQGCDCSLHFILFLVVPKF